MDHLGKEKDVRRLQAKLIRWYQDHRRDLPWRRTRHPYPIWVSEVMLQQTQVRTVIPYFQRFMECFPDIQRLAEADQEAVLKQWEGLGYYARARNLHRAARLLQEQCQGMIPRQRQALKKLPGIGDYISAAISSIAFGRPYSVVDGNVKRVLARLFMSAQPVNAPAAHKTYQALADRLLDKKHPGTYNQALMELGALICKPAGPLCEKCPLTEFCLAFQNQATTAYPQRLQRQKVPLHPIAVGVVYRQGRVLITRRRDEGLLGGLWEFPGGKVRDDETPEQACVREIKEETHLRVGVTGFLKQVRHAYTHFKIKMDVFCCQYIAGEVQLRGPVAYRWIKLAEIGDFPFPKANHKFIPDLLKKKQG